MQDTVFNADTTFLEIESPVDPAVAVTQTGQVGGTGVLSINGVSGDVTFSTATPVNGVGLNIVAAGATVTFSITGVEAMAGIKCNFAATVDPTINDDSGDGYDYGSLWLNRTTPKWFGCSDPALGGAVWTDLS
jgi:hypothetical protein